MRHPTQAADLFLSMFLGDGHIRGLLKLDMPDEQKNKALLREAVRGVHGGLRGGRLKNSVSGRQLGRGLPSWH